MRKTIFKIIDNLSTVKHRRMLKKGKEQCEYCLKYFKKKELDELILTEEKICKKCLKELEDMCFPNDPEPFSC
nr:MAG: hypothetical protein [uncultured archaeon]BDI55252.1 MAG: hypothetical protein [uncultured archaeon]